MKYNIYAIGNMRRSPEAEIFLKYSKRIKNIEFFEYVSNFDEKNKKINDESKKLLSMIKNENISKNVDLTISLSNMTFPHMLARIVLVEQIYRSETIINNHPYHKI